MTTKTKPFRNDLLKRMGGPDQFDFTLGSFCDRLLEDKRLSKFYDTFEISAMMDTHRRLLTLAFTAEDGSDMGCDPLWLRFHNMFLSGMNERHFDRIAGHYEAVLQEGWMEQAVVEDALSLFKRLRDVFEDKAIVEEEMNLNTLRDALAVKSHSGDDLKEMQDAVRRSRSRSRSGERGGEPRRGSGLQKPTRRRSGEGLIGIVRRKSGEGLQVMRKKSGEGLSAMASAVKQKRRGSNESMEEIAADLEKDLNAEFSDEELAIDI